MFAMTFKQTLLCLYWPDVLNITKANYVLTNFLMFSTFFILTKFCKFLYEANTDVLNISGHFQGGASHTASVHCTKGESTVQHFLLLLNISNGQRFYPDYLEMYHEINYPTNLENSGAASPNQTVGRAGKRDSRQVDFGQFNLFLLLLIILSSFSLLTCLSCF